jgi:hypothetical protein
MSQKRRLVSAAPWRAIACIESMCGVSGRRYVTGWSQPGIESTGKRLSEKNLSGVVARPAVLLAVSTLLTMSVVADPSEMRRGSLVMST